MMSDINTYLIPRKSPLIRRDMFRSALLYLAFLTLFGITIFLGLLVNDYKDLAQRQERGNTRTVEEFVNGGKRFLDYFLSLNSSTVEFDHYRATTMMVSEKERAARRKYLLEADYYRRVIDAQMMSKIDWSKSRHEVLESSETHARVEYIVSILLDRKTSKAAHIVLNITAVDKSDEYPDGIGIESVLDVAAEPFKEKKQ